MTLEAEVSGLHDHPEDASKLVYTPLREPLTFRRTRRYQLEFDGDTEAVRAFVTRTLVDEVSQQVRFGSAPALAGFACIIDYGFKPGALDLEKEMILSYYRGLPDPGFALRRLTILQRVYLFSAGAAVDPGRFVRDMVNPAIHRHAVHAG